MIQKKRVTLSQTVMANVLKVAYLNKISDTDLASIMGVSAATISNRKRKPEDMTLKELDDFCLSTHTDYNEILK